MLSIGTIPIVLKIISKLDIKPVIEILKSADLFEDVTTSEDAVKEVSAEKVGEVGRLVLAEGAPQLGKIADDVPVLAAKYKNISIEEAEKLDALELFYEMWNDEGVRTFFKNTLRKKVEQGT